MAFVNILEFVIFVTPPDGIAIALPAIVFATVYFATWLKFWFLDEGDLRELRFWSMIDLIQRTLGELPSFEKPETLSERRRRKRKRPNTPQEPYNADSFLFDEPHESSMSEDEATDEENLLVQEQPKKK